MIQRVLLPLLLLLVLVMKTTPPMKDKVAIWMLEIEILTVSTTVETATRIPANCVLNVENISIIRRLTHVRTKSHILVLCVARDI